MQYDGIYESALRKIKNNEMKTKATYIPGDGVSKITGDVVLRILDAAGAGISWDVQVCGKQAIKEHGVPLPPPLILSLKTNKLALKGKLDALEEGEFTGKNPTVLLRQVLDLYCNIRPVKNVPGVKGLYDDLDSVVIRQATEGVYSGLEHVIAPGVVESVKVTTRPAAERIAKFAFEYARKNKRKKVTTIHKANIMKMGDGLFLKTSQEIAKQYPDIAHNHIIVDNCCMQLVLKPQQFDVLLVENLYGDIVADLGSGIAGGISASAGISQSDALLVFESGHAKTKDFTRDENANPLPLLMAGVFLLETTGSVETAGRIKEAVKRSIEKNICTPDLGGSATMSIFVEEIIKNL